jgi:ABC-type uncharacterized transport system permease subunit
MKLRHRIAALTCSFALASAGLLITEPAAHAVSCGDQPSDWTGLLLSTWTMHGDINDVDFTAAVVLVTIGNATVVQDTATLDSYSGFYQHQEDVNNLSFTAVTPVVGNPFDSLAFVVEATACTGLFGNRVDAAHGMVIRQNVGRVGSVDMQRVL